VGFVSRRDQDPADGAGDGANTRTAAGELPTGVAQFLEQVLATRDGLLAQLGQRLNRTASHPAGSVGPVVT
jgi:hypothetical protein